MTALPFPERIRTATAYVADWSDIDRSDFIRLDRNESAHPAPEGVLEALTTAVSGIGVHCYPDSHSLLEPLARYCGVPVPCILPTNGSDQGIDLVLRAFLSPARRMLIARPEFPVFGHVAETLGAEIVGVPYRDDFSFPYQEFEDAARSGQHQLIVVISPNNPTGTPVDPEFIHTLCRRCPGVPIVVDEAYYEYTGQTVVGLTQKYPNLIVLRTFSKAFAMAGLRLGYIVADPEVTGEIVKLANPFDVNGLAVVAGIAQLKDLSPMRSQVSEVMEISKPMVVERLRAAQVPIVTGAANFVLVEPEACEVAVDSLRKQGILVRPMSSDRLRGMFRVSMGTPSEMAQFVEAFGSYLESGSG